MKNFIEKYFTDHIQYPSMVAENILPMNEHWAYISTTFLNGFINYVKPIKAFVLTRYTAWESNLEHEVSLRDPVSGNWEKHAGTKDEIYRLFIQPGRNSHTNLHSLEDDVLILAKTDGDSPCYFFFWFDCDVSDGCIGRFQTSAPEEEVVADFVEYALSMKDMGYEDSGESREIPLHSIEGWVSF